MGILSFHVVIFVLFFSEDWSPRNTANLLDLMFLAYRVYQLDVAGSWFKQKNTRIYVSWDFMRMHGIFMI